MIRETLRAAFVIARRDLVALIASKAFVFFLIGPLVLMAIGLGAAGLGSHMAQDVARPVIAVSMSGADAARIKAAHDTIDDPAASLPALDTQPPAGLSPAALLAPGHSGPSYVAVLGGTPDRPVLHVRPGEERRWTAATRLVLAAARDPAGTAVRVVAVTGGPAAPPAPPDREFTAQIAQTALFLFTMLLAGMVLSNLVEEKANKIIEILAASVPVDAIFLGKLGAMLIMAFIGIGVWTGSALILSGLSSATLAALPEPAVGWPLFGVLALVYFATAYLLLGALFIGIGAMAATVREVQTLSMPVSMAQLGVFFLASYALPHLGKPVELVAVVFPFSSPFAMVARAAQQDLVWTHLAAILWQGLWVVLILRAGAMLFRRNVLKSGGGRGFWRIRRVSRSR